MNEDYSTPRVQKMRAHQKGQHNLCGGECPEALAEQKRMVYLQKRRAIADLLTELGHDASTLMPDFDEVNDADVTPTFVEKAQAKLRIHKEFGIDDYVFPSWTQPGGPDPTYAELSAYSGPETDRVKQLRKERDDEEE